MIQRHILTVPIYDPGQDSLIPLLKVPDDHLYTVEKATVTVDRAVAASETELFAATLLNGGTDQTGTAAISNAIGGAGGWEANTPVSFTITAGAGDLSAGQWLLFKYDETVTEGIAPGLVTVSVEYVDGVGSKA